MGGRRWNCLSGRGGSGGVGADRWGRGGGRAFEHHDTKRNVRHEGVQEVRVVGTERRREAAEGSVQAAARPTPRCFCAPGCIPAMIQLRSHSLRSVTSPLVFGLHVLLHPLAAPSLTPLAPLLAPLRVAPFSLVSSLRPSPIARPPPRVLIPSILSIGRRWRSTTRATRSGSPTTNACMM